MLKPGLFTATLFSGVDYLNLGQPAEAVRFLQEAMRMQPENPEATLAIARAYAQLHQLRLAAQAYESAVGVSPESSAAWYGLAVAALALIEQDGGTLALKYGDSVWARMLYADELLKQSRPREAAQLYSETSRAATPLDRAKFLRVLEVSASANAIPQEVLQVLRKVLQPATQVDFCVGSGPSSESGACAFLGGDYARSAAQASAALTKDDAEVEALYWSVKANEQRAVLSFSRFEALAPQSPATFDLTGDLYRRRDMPEQALAEYAMALVADPDDPAALLGTAASLLAEGHAGKAFAIAKAGLVARPEDQSLNRIAGEALVAQRQFAEALPYLEHGLEGNPASDAHVHALLGRVAAEGQQTQKAIVEMRLGLPSDRDGSLHFQLYRLLRKSGDVVGAQEAEAGARALQAQRRQHAVTAVEEMQLTPN